MHLYKEKEVCDFILLHVLFFKVCQTSQKTNNCAAPSSERDEIVAFHLSVTASNCLAIA